MSATWFSGYFQELGAFAVPAKLPLQGSDRNTEVLRQFKSVRWLDLDEKSLLRVISLLVAGVDINLIGYVPFEERVLVRKRYIDYLIEKQNGRVSWAQIEDGFTFDRLSEALGNEADEAGRETLGEILNSEKYCDNGLFGLALFRFTDFGLPEPRLSEVCAYAERHASTILLGLKGAARLGGEGRMARALNDLLDTLEKHPAHALEVFRALQKSGIDRNLYWRRMPSSVKGRLLEFDLGM